MLADLAAKSFLCVHLDGDRVLYEMLDTVRGYALEKIDSSQDDLEPDTHDPPVRGQYSKCNVGIANCRQAQRN